MLVCAFCVVQQLQCGCGTNYPFKSMNGVLYCMGCKQGYRGQFTNLKAMVEERSDTDSEGNVIGIYSCPVHAAYRIGIPKVNVQQCSKCGHVEERPIKGAPNQGGMSGIQKANDDPDAVRRSIFGG